MKEQLSENRRIAPEKTMGNFRERIFVLMLNLFISPPEYGLIENLAPTHDDLSAYLSIPGHNLFRGIIWGGIFFTITIFGMYSALRDVFSTQFPTKRDLILLLLTTFCLIFGLGTALQIYWIRYSIPLIPFMSLWMAYGLTALWTLGKSKINSIHSNV